MAQPLDVQYALRAADRVFRLQIADRPESQRRGLMWRERLPPDQGLLMVMPKAMEIGVWMKNMHFALDVVWLSVSWQVLDVKTLMPCRTTRCPVYTPRVKARYLLEVGAGQFPLKVGQKVEIIHTSGDSLPPQLNAAQP